MAHEPIARADVYGIYNDRTCCRAGAYDITLEEALMGSSPQPMGDVLRIAWLRRVFVLRPEEFNRIADACKKASK